jgi:membrane protein DedA with SNARE-associated domain
VEEISHLVGDLEPFVRHYGVFAVMLVLMMESLGAPAPGETLLIFAAVLVANGEMSLPALLVFAWAGVVIGANIGYAIGRKLGRTMIHRYGAKVGLNETRFSAVEDIYRRYGSQTVLFAEFLGILRQLNGIVAGALGMSWPRFVPLNAVAAALWVALWVFAASYFSEHLHALIQAAHHKWVVAGVLAAVALALAVHLLIRHRRERLR